MGQKARPIGLRVGITRTWDSLWYAGDKEYADNLHQDLAIRKYIEKNMRFSGVSRVVIERSAKKVRVSIHTSRPGVIIGKKGADIETIKVALSKIAGSEVSLNIIEIRKPEADAKLIGESIAQQLEKRVSFRRAMKRSMQSAIKMGAQGIRINCSGRLGGAEIARMEWYREGRVPLHTLRADIDYALVEAHTAYGIIGIKVWVYKGDVYSKDVADIEQKKIANDLTGKKGENSGA